MNRHAEFTAAAQPAVTIYGGTRAEQQLIARCFAQRLGGLVPAEPPLRIEIVAPSEMQRRVREDDGDDLRGQDSAGASSDGSGADVDGIYDEPGAQFSSIRPHATITLLQGEDAPDFTQTFLHEFGHHFWTQAMNDKERAEFNQIYREAASSREFVSDYASASPEEDFAEAFAYTEINSKLLWKRDAGAARFVSSLLKRKRAHGFEAGSAGQVEVAVSAG